MDEVEGIWRMYFAGEREGKVSMNNLSLWFYVINYMKERTEYAENKK